VWDRAARRVGSGGSSLRTASSALGQLKIPAAERAGKECRDGQPEETVAAVLRRGGRSGEVAMSTRAGEELSAQMAAVPAALTTRQCTGFDSLWEAADQQCAAGCGDQLALAVRNDVFGESHP